MSAAYTPSQRSAISQFVQFTQAKDSVAAKALKATNWDLNTALNTHYAKNSKSASHSQAPAISAVFDTYRDEPQSTPDGISAEGTMKYFQDIGVSVEEPLMVAVLSVVGAETIGELERDKFVSGWEAYSSSISSVASMTTAAAHMRAQLITDPAFFKSVYKHAFLLARVPGQKGAQADMAIEFWRLLFSQKGLVWRSKSTDWLELWCQYVTEKWTRPVSKDMWNQLEVFARKTLEDETLGFWTETSSWPTVIDEFVAYAKERITNGNKMDVE